MSRTIAEHLQEFKCWLESTLNDQIRDIIRNEVSSQFGMRINDETKLPFASAEGRIPNLEEGLKKVKEENEKYKKGVQ